MFFSRKVAHEEEENNLFLSAGNIAELNLQRIMTSLAVTLCRIGRRPELKEPNFPIKPVYISQ